MIDFINGTVTKLSQTTMVLDTGRIGYFVNITTHTSKFLEDNKMFKMLIHEVIKEDSHVLYGFCEEEEREMFRKLISVQGVGPNTAKIMLSYLFFQEMRKAIEEGDVDAIKSIKGIGTKTAQSVVIALRGKMTKSKDLVGMFAPKNNPVKDDAITALSVLG